MCSIMGSKRKLGNFVWLDHNKKGAIVNPHRFVIPTKEESHQQEYSYSLLLQFVFTSGALSLVEASSCGHGKDFRAIELREFVDISGIRQNRC
jgi:hypothetical protein